MDDIKAINKSAVVKDSKKTNITIKEKRIDRVSFTVGFVVGIITSIIGAAVWSLFLSKLFEK